MNTIAVLILSIIVFELIVRAVADVFNIKNMQTQPPKAFENVYDPDRYRQSSASGRG